ncbi:MAG: hypothetical protein MUF31_16640, partial [Akkermansiaceae bacterium]|nr:hypothetical protein [Akkermansiaceae bacterium]
GFFDGIQRINNLRSPDALRRFTPGVIHNQKKNPSKTRRDNPYQPSIFNDFPQFQPQPRDRRAPSLVGAHALIIVPENEKRSRHPDDLHSVWTAVVWPEGTKLGTARGQSNRVG